MSSYYGDKMHDAIVQIRQSTTDEDAAVAILWWCAYRDARNRHYRQINNEGKKRFSLADVLKVVILALPFGSLLTIAIIHWHR